MMADMKEFEIAIFHTENSEEQRRIVAKEILSFDDVKMGGNKT